MYAHRPTVAYPEVWQRGLTKRLRKVCHMGLTKRFDEVCVRDAFHWTTKGVDEMLWKLCHRGLTKRFDKVCVRDTLRCTTKGVDERFDKDLWWRPLTNNIPFSLTLNGARPYIYIYIYIYMGGRGSFKSYQVTANCLQYIAATGTYMFSLELKQTCVWTIHFHWNSWDNKAH